MGLFVPSNIASTGQQRTFEVACGLPDSGAITGLEPFTLVASDMRQPQLVRQRMLAAVQLADPARCTYLIEKEPAWRP